MKHFHLFTGNIYYAGSDDYLDSYVSLELAKSAFAQLLIERDDNENTRYGRIYDSSAGGLKLVYAYGQSYSGKQWDANLVEVK